MTTPRRYVRVRRVRQWSHHSRFGRYYSPWSEAICAFCAYSISDEDHVAAILAADEHARTCPAVRAAMERDQLAREVSHLRQELTDRRLITYDTRAERDQLRAERDQWRTKAHELAAELLLRDERKETR